MDRYDRVFAQLRSFPWMQSRGLQAIEQYVNTGDSRLLSRVNPKDEPRWVWEELARKLPSPGEMDEIDWRVVHGMAAHECWQVVGEWVGRSVVREKPEEDLFGVIYTDLTANRIPLNVVHEMLLKSTCDFSRGGLPNSVGRYVLSLADRDLRSLFREAAATAGGRAVGLLRLLFENAPDRVRTVLNELRSVRDGYILAQVCEVVLRYGGEAYEPWAADVLRSERNAWSRFLTGQYLADFKFERYGAETLKAARAALAVNADQSNHDRAAIWMIDHYGREVAADMADYMRQKNGTSTFRKAILSHCVSTLGPDALPICVAALDAHDGATRFEGLTQLVALNDESQRPLMVKEFERGFQAYAAKPEPLIKFINLAARWDPTAVESQIWPLLEQKSKPVREAAARALGKLGQKAVPQAGRLLSERKAEMRMIGAMILADAGTPEALDLLENRVASEEDDNVREAILGSLETAWKVSGKKLTREDVEYWATQYEGRVRWPPVRWLADAALPPLSYVDGSPVPEGIVRYMLCRQSKSGDVKPLLELGPLYYMVDRSSGGDFALDLLRMFIASGAEAKDRWAMTLAALLGDDRTVPVLNSQIREWADGNRGKLAEYAVQALALLATDRALMTLDSLAMRYRTKMKNVGNAAVEAFAAAAESLGVTPEELGDKVVPWLGFEPGKPRVIDCGTKRIVVRIGPDFKLRYSDPETGKKVGSIPSSASNEMKAQFKQLSADLREISKAQILRMENLMVRQHRWPASRWEELFLDHPVLAPFGLRLVWAAYDASGLISATFRALEDRSLTNQNDEPVALADDHHIAILHPLEIDEESRGQWATHLADYEVESPFPQMERPVVTVSPESMGAKYCKDFTGTSVNGMTFKGRAERLGWRRGSVCDGGWISTYTKSFPAAGVDAFILLENMFIGIDMYSDIHLGDAFFTKAGTVRTGSYEYDEPSDESDPRLIPFGQVPPVVFSEVMGDLKRIAGQREDG